MTPDNLIMLVNDDTGDTCEVLESVVCLFYLGRLVFWHDVPAETAAEWWADEKNVPVEAIELHADTLDWAMGKAWDEPEFN